MSAPRGIAAGRAAFARQHSKPADDPEHLDDAVLPTLVERGRLLHRAHNGDSAAAARIAWADGVEAELAASTADTTTEGE